MADRDKATQSLVSASQRIGAGAVLTVALLALYLAAVLLLTLVSASPDWKIVATTAGFIVAAIGVPALLSDLLRRRGWQWRRAVTVAALVCLGVCLCLVPVALAAMAM